STYQPSVSMCCFDGSQPGPEGALSITVFTCRACSPTIALRPPVSVMVVVTNTTPGVCGAAPGAAAGAGTPGIPPSGTTMYELAAVMTCSVRFRSYCLMTMT